MSSFDCSTLKHIRLPPLLSNSLKKSHGKNLDKSWIQTTYWQAKYSGKPYVICAANKHQLPPLSKIQSVLLKHQTGILNHWRKYCCELLNLVTAQYLETSEEQIGEEIHLTKAQVSTAIKSLKAGKSPRKDDI